MKNYGLQLKEIPIIFRGDLPASVDPEILSFHANGEDPQQITDKIWNWWIQGDTWTPEDLANFRINLVNVKTGNTYTIYENPPCIMSPDGDELLIGSMIDRETSDFENPDFPFLVDIKYYPDTEDCSINLYAYYEGEEEEPFSLLAIEGTIGDPIISKKLMTCDITGNGSIRRFYVRFAVGENGTLHIRPYVILNGNIRVDLCNFAEGGNKYISGDDETISFDCYVPVETHAVAYVEAENVGEYPSIIDAAMVVEYEDCIEPESIVGYEGINLRRR